MDASDHYGDLDARPAKRARVDETHSPASSSDNTFDDADDLYDSPMKPDATASAPAAAEAETEVTSLLNNEPPTNPSPIGLDQPSSKKDSPESSSDEDDFYDQNSHDQFDPQITMPDVVEGTVNGTTDTSPPIPQQTTLGGQAEVSSVGEIVATVKDDVIEEITQTTVQTISAADPTVQDNQDDKSTTKVDPIEGAEQKYPVKVTPEDDAEFMEAAEANKDKADAEWQYDSSDAQSLQDSSDSKDGNSSENEDEDEEDFYELLTPEEQARILMREDGPDEKGNNKEDGSNQPRTTNEQPETKAEKPDVTITADMSIAELGVADKVVENHLLIKGNVSGETQVLQSGSLLCLEDRTVIGAVTEPLGRVQQPYYSVLFNNKAEIDELAIEGGTKIFYVPSHSEYVFTMPLKLVKGSDASNKHDEEVGEDEIEFSDDEAEAEHKRKLKRDKQARKTGQTGSSNDIRGSTTATVDRRPVPGYPNTAMNYDDNEDEDDFYTPLRRPENMNEIPPKPPQERWSGRGSSDRGRGFRGRGRGKFRDSKDPRSRRGNDRTMNSNRGRRDSAGHQYSPTYESSNRPQYSPSSAASGQGHSPYAQPAQQPISPQFFSGSPEGYHGYQGQSMSPIGVVPYPQSLWNQPSPVSGYNPHFPSMSQNMMPASPTTAIPPGAFVNPAFFRNQQQQQQQQQHAHPRVSHDSYEASSQTQQQLYGAAYGYPQRNSFSSQNQQIQDSSQDVQPYDPTQPLL